MWNRLNGSVRFQTGSEPGEPNRTGPVRNRFHFSGFFKFATFLTEKHALASRDEMYVLKIRVD
jgi:hypothetical protein